MLYLVMNYMDKIKNKVLFRELTLNEDKIKREKSMKSTQDQHHFTINMSKFNRTFKDDVSLSEYRDFKKYRLLGLFRNHILLVIICAVAFILFSVFIFSPKAIHRLHFF